MTQAAVPQTVHNDLPGRRRWPAPWIFSVLILPQGIFLGFITTVLPFLLGKASVPLNRIANTTSLLSLPWIICFLWSPLVDWALRRQIWLIIWAALTAFCLGVAVPLANSGNVNLVRLLGLAGAVSASMVLATCGGLIVTTLSPTLQPRGAAWYQAGKLSGSALGAALLLWLAERLSSALLGVVAFLIVAVPALVGLTIVGEWPGRSTGFRQGLSEIKRQLVNLAHDSGKRWNLLLVASPIGTGAALTLFPAFARSYGVGSSGVIWTNGIGGGLVLALGALCGTFFPRRWNCGCTYIVAGVMNALAAMTLLLGNRPIIYFVGVILYFGTTGLCWARFAALVVEIVGSVNQEASTRYTAVTALGNIPLAYMTWLDGVGSAHFGVRGLLWTDACGSFFVLAVAIFQLKRSIERFRLET